MKKFCVSLLFTVTVLLILCGCSPRRVALPGGNYYDPDAEIRYCQLVEALFGPYPTSESLSKSGSIFKGKVAGGSFNFIIYDKYYNTEEDYQAGKYNVMFNPSLSTMITPIEVTEVFDENRNLKVGDVIYVGEQCIYCDETLCEKPAMERFAEYENCYVYVRNHLIGHPPLNPEHEYLFFGNIMKMTDFEINYLRDNKCLDKSLINGKIDEFIYCPDLFDLTVKPERGDKTVIELYNDVMAKYFGEKE